MPIFSSVLHLPVPRLPRCSTTQTSTGLSSSSTLQQKRSQLWVFCRRVIHSSGFFHKAEQKPTAQNWSIPKSWVRYLARSEVKFTCKNKQLLPTRTHTQDYVKWLHLLQSVNVLSGLSNVTSEISHLWEQTTFFKSSPTSFNRNILKTSNSLKGHLRSTAHPLHYTSVSQPKSRHLWEQQGYHCCAPEFLTPILQLSQHQSQNDNATAG